MSVSKKVLRRMKKVMGVVGASASLIPMSSQISCADFTWNNRGFYYTYNPVLCVVKRVHSENPLNVPQFYKLWRMFKDENPGEKAYFDISNLGVDSSGLTRLEYGFFNEELDGCGVKNLEITLYISDNLKIEKGAFRNMLRLKNVNFVIDGGIGKTINIEIDEGAFHNCVNLNSIDINANGPSFHEFYGKKGCSVKVFMRKNCIKFDENDIKWRQRVVDGRFCDPISITYRVNNNCDCTFDIDDNAFNYYNWVNVRRDDYQVVIGYDNVNRVKYYYCNKKADNSVFNKATLNVSLLADQEKKFEKCGRIKADFWREMGFECLPLLHELYVSGCSLIEGNSFKNAKFLRKISLGGTMQLGSGVFYGCDNIEQIDVPDGGCIYIEKDTFGNCNSYVNSRVRSNQNFCCVEW